MAGLRSGGFRSLWVCGVALALGGAGLGYVWSSYPAGMVRQAEAAYERGDWSEAARLAAARLRHDPNDPEALRLLARSCVRRQRNAAALAIYARLAPEQVAAEDQHLKGLALGRLGKLDAAAEALEAALVAEPDRAETLEVLCQLATRQHRLDRASNLGARLSRLPGHAARGTRMLGVIRADMNDVEGAAEALGRALADPAGSIARGGGPEPAAFRKLFARTLLQTGRAAEAEAQLAIVLGAGPDPEASWLLSRAALQQGRRTEAAQALGRAGSFRDEHPEAGEPAPHVGEARCAGCHQTIGRAVRRTRHARTFHRGRELLDLPLPEQPLSDPGDPAIVHAFRRENDRLVAETRVGGKTHRAFIEYAFGTAERYLTMVGRDADGVARACRLSYHRSDDGTGTGWDLTSGDSARPERRDDYRGRPIDTREGVVRCLACHTTNVRLGTRRAGPETSDRGIGCEHCHGPGGNHPAAVAAGLADLAILRPGAGAGGDRDRDRACVACHTLNEALSEQVFPRDDPVWVRSPGKALTWSRCHAESGGRLGCLTCHDPHRDAEKSPGFYARRCLSCHAATASDPSPPCPVNPREDCASCHMPRVRNALLHASLTDHYIRIHPRSDRSEPPTQRSLP